MSQDHNALDSNQSASAAQFNRQSDRYGKSHILADTQDVEQGLRGVSACPGGTALDVATGGGHTALWLARHGWKVTAGNIAPRMLENAQKLCAEAGYRIETAATPGENREQVLEAVAKVSEHVKAVLRLGNEEGKIVWRWPMLTLLASKNYPLRRTSVAYRHVELSLWLCIDGDLLRRLIPQT